jgi:carbon monoxide dehydrogenase subunit G
MTITDSIHIAAPPGVVWDVTVDVERWSEWTPTVSSVTVLGEAPIRMGSVARIRQPGQPEADWVVTEFVREQRFTWETRRRGLRIIGSHALHSEGVHTRNELRIDASGPLAVLLWPVLRFALRRALRDENRGLKERCERGGAGNQ